MVGPIAWKESDVKGAEDRRRIGCKRSGFDKLPSQPDTSGPTLEDSQRQARAGEPVLWETRGARSASVQQRATDEIDGDLAIVLGGATEAGQVGSAFTLASRIQAAQTNDQVAQSSQVLRRVAGAHGRSIFAEGHIAHVVDTFDPPVAPAEGLQLGRVHFGSRAAAEHDLGFLGDVEGFEIVSGAGNDGGLN